MPAKRHWYMVIYTKYWWFIKLRLKFFREATLEAAALEKFEEACSVGILNHPDSKAGEQGALLFSALTSVDLGTLLCHFTTW
ncbi:hypothetical protein [Limnohabitans radicicola]|uniref:hypothetical protein n=1 Tax=Limnohabitans radicicola TaxID=2771427 RepID=UPI001E533E16|nr:hypothetical protein [Limnohabitans radicicola]